MPEETLIVEASMRDILEILLHGEVYDETNDTRRAAALKLQPDKTLRTHSLMVGADVNNRERTVRVDSNRAQWIRHYKDYVQVDPLEIGNGGVANNLLFDPGTTAAELYEVSFLITNTNGALITVTIGADVTGTGTVTHPWMDGETIPYPGTSGWREGGVIDGADHVRGVTSAVGAIVHWRIRRADAGA